MIEYKTDAFGFDVAINSDFKKFNKLARIAEETVHDWYNKLSYDFGLIKRDMSVRFSKHSNTTPNGLEFSGLTLSFYETYDENTFPTGFILYINVAILTIETERILNQTIPHEVCHMINCIIYPEITSREEEYHGKAWQELMRYCKLEPYPYFDTNDEYIAQFELIKDLIS